MTDCIFCKMVAGKLPCYNVFDSQNYFAFLDIYPRVKGHTILIPKKHYQWVYDVPDFGQFWQTALTITHALQKSLKPTFVTYVTHGLQVPHAHIHIMPRQNETEFIPEPKQFKTNEFVSLAELIKKAL